MYSIPKGIAVLKYPKHIKPNDRIVFLGDSITEAQMYTNYVEAYLALRYPELNLTFFNVGWAGECAPVGLTRLDRDVLSLKPTLVTICYGMNDGRYTHASEQIREDFVSGMSGIIAGLKKAGIRIVLLTPGFVDETLSEPLVAVRYNTQALRMLADEVLVLAKKHRLPCCDIHALMTQVDRDAKAHDKSFTLEMFDGVHPNEAGHLVMAYGLLKALGVPERQDIVDIDLETGRSKASGGIHTSIQRNYTRTNVSISLSQVPFNVPQAARTVLPYLPFIQTYNSLRLRVAGCDDAKYIIRCSHKRKGVLDSKALNTGIELLEEWQSDPMQDAASAGYFINDKDAVFNRMWRGMALRDKLGKRRSSQIFLTGARASEKYEHGREDIVRDARRDLLISLEPAPANHEPHYNLDFIASWALAGPFGPSFHDDYLGGEAAASGQLPVLGSMWKPHMFSLDDFGTCLDKIYGQLMRACVYAITVIDSPIEQNCALLIGSDDGLAIWLNSELINSNLDNPRPVTIDQDRFAVKLKAGKNILLLKISQYAVTWGFCARFDGLAKPVSVGCDIA